MLWQDWAFEMLVILIKLQRNPAELHPGWRYKTISCKPNQNFESKDLTTSTKLLQKTCLNWQIWLSDRCLWQVKQPVALSCLIFYQTKRETALIAQTSACRDQKAHNPIPACNISLWMMKYFVFFLFLPPSLSSSLPLFRPLGCGFQMSRRSSGPRRDRWWVNLCRLWNNID